MWAKYRIQNLERVQASIAPRYSYEIETQLSACRFKHKLLSWLSFPINQLPEETLVDIFRWVLYSSSTPAESTRHRLHLTWVCRLWRDVAIRDKQLWSVLWFRDRPPYTRSLTWLDRAGSVPLEIRINETERRRGEAEHPKLSAKQMADVLDKILLKVSTIRIMVIVVDTWPPALVALHKLRDSGVPLMLERFELHRAGHPYGWTPPGMDPDEVKNPIALFNGNAPKLQWLTINGLNIDWYRSPLSNLTTLDLRRMTMAACPSMPRFREILVGCPRLYRLAVDASGPKWEREGETLVPLLIPSLREILVGDFSVQYTKFVLSQIVAPRVISLSLMNMNGEDFGPLIEYLVGRFPLVEILSIYTTAVHDDRSGENLNMGRLVSWLRSMPRLYVLKVAHVLPIMLEAFLEDPRNHCLVPDGNDVAMTRENQKEEREVLCPGLRYLQFQTQEPDLILRLTEGRQQLNAPFTRVYITPKDIGNPDMVLVAPRIKKSIGEFYINTNILYVDEEYDIHKKATAEDEKFFATRDH